ncbi:ankyrin repeat-containing domain protein [Tuber brumale]|nr:ankyrin repeat-containing domain protein [Tuber brumale]
MGMLRTAIASIPRVFICIDALDECLPKHLPELLGSLRGIVRESPGTRIFLTGRPHVRDDIRRYFATAVVISISPNTDDIRNYLELRLGRDEMSEAMNDDLRADIIRVVLEKISDIFLLVSLNIDSILGEVTISQRRKKLEKMTQGNGLSDAYMATLNRLRAQKGNKSALGLRVLMWVLYSERPLQANELCHALGVEVGSTDLDVENVPALRTLLSSCLGLVTVEASSSTVRLVHFTLQEYLSSDPTLFHSPHATIAEVCLTYLNFDCIRDLSPTVFSAPSMVPLLEYASCYWGNHMRRGMSEDVKTLALKLLHGFDKHISAQLILLHYNRHRGSGPYFFGTGGPSGFTGLHGVSFLGLGGIVSAVLEIKEWDMNATDCTGSTALTWAAGRGHEDVVKALLEHGGVNPNTADTRYQRTPLYWAVKCGDVGVVKMLLERKDVNPNTADTEYGQTPLCWAAERGREGIVKMLLEREDINPNTADTEYGQTPLCWAAESGHEGGVVKMLLEREDINPNTASTIYGRTPLCWATKRGHEGVVKMLLEREDVNPNTADTMNGRTPLCWAAESGHEGVVKMLLERADVNSNTADTKYGRTPLSWAVDMGNERVVKLLSKQKDICSPPQITGNKRHCRGLSPAGAVGL